MSKQTRIERILNEPLTGPLARARTKQVLAILAVVSSWVYLLTLAPGNYIELAFPGSYLVIRMFASIAMLASYVFLRRSVRHITSVPVEYLDERQMLNRDWAYSAGYLVVRRVGLVLSIAFVGFMVGYSVWNQIYYGTGQVDPVDPAAQAIYRSVVDYFRAYFAIDPLQATGSVLLLLTYVAYSFPIILLAWRDAKTNDESEVAEIESSQWLRILTRSYTGYFMRVAWILAGVALSFIGIFTEVLRSMSFAFWALFGTVFYALYVYGWGMFEQWQAVKLLGQRSELPQLEKAKNLLFGLFVALSLIGVSILVVMISVTTRTIGSEGATWLNYCVWGGLVLLVLHLVSFALIRKVVRENTQE